VAAPVESGGVDARRVADRAGAHRAGHVVVWDGAAQGGPVQGAAGTSATDLTSGLGEDVELSVLTRAADAQWRLRPLERARQGPGTGASAVVRRPAARGGGRAR